jgi:hypothetical protein
MQSAFFVLIDFDKENPSAFFTLHRHKYRWYVFFSHNLFGKIFEMFCLESYAHFGNLILLLPNHADFKSASSFYFIFLILKVF